MFRHTIAESNLLSAKKGDLFVITGVPGGKPEAQLIRLGIYRGEIIRCIERLPGGTIIILKHRQEIAIGQGLASEILVSPIDQPNA